MEIAKHQKFTTQEISRNLSRLNEVGLTYKDVEGFYHLSPLGELTITLLREFEFISRHKSYFTDHRVSHLPQEFLKSLSELSGSHETKSLMDFLHYMDTIINESKEFVSLLVDQYPLMVIGSMINAIKRGVRVNIIGSSEATAGPSMDLVSLEDSEAINRVGFMPHVEQRTTKRVDEFIIYSESKCAIAFPTRDGKFDYIGFVSSDEKSMRWCSRLFQYSWENVGKGTEAEVTSELLASIEPPRSKLGKITLEGKNGEGDAQALQNAVNNYKEVVLRGTFEFGKQSILVDRSVTIKGEGRKDGFPSTKLHKRGWTFPSANFDSVFNVVGKDADVTIENIHFTDFNCSCIHGILGRSLRIRNNAITLGSDYGRGWKYERFGDTVTGIWVDGLPENFGESNFDAGVTVERNYIDFAFQPEQQNIPFITYPEPNQNNTQNFPDLNNHEYYIGMGINLLNLSGKVSIKENTIINMNGRGISVTNNLPTSVVNIKQNLIKSEIKGSYPFTGDDAGFGIFAQCSFMYRKLGFKVEIEDNVLQLLKPDYCGITVLELSLSGKSSDFMTGSVTNNQINLLDGTAGLRIGSRSLDVAGNKITGSAYFGVQTTGFRTVKNELESGSRIKDNDVSELKIMELSMWRTRRSVAD